MTPDDFRSVRQDFNLSQRQMANIIGAGSDRTVRKYEAGARLPAAAQLLIWLYQRHPELMAEIAQAKKDLGLPPATYYQLAAE